MPEPRRRPPLAGRFRVEPRPDGLTITLLPPTWWLGAAIVGTLGLVLVGGFAALSVLTSLPDPPSFAPSRQGQVSLGLPATLGGAFLVLAGLSVLGGLYESRVCTIVKASPDALSLRRSTPLGVRDLGTWARGQLCAIRPGTTPSRGGPKSVLEVVVGPESTDDLPGVPPELLMVPTLAGASLTKTELEELAGLLRTYLGVPAEPKGKAAGKASVEEI